VGTLRLPASEDSIMPLRQFALDTAQRAGLDQLALQRVELVLEEALVNVIHHGYGPDTPAERRQVELSCGVEADGVLRLTLTDWGSAFDPVAVAQTAPALEATLEANLEADLDHRAPGGMGLFLMRTMAEAGYERRGDANVLTLRFPSELPVQNR